MIGGYILDASAVRQLAQGNPYMIARVYVAVEKVQALYVPTTALAAGLVGHDLTAARREQVEQALEAPAFQLHDLDQPTALAAAELATMCQVDIASAHVAHLALRRPGLPVLTTRPSELHKVHPAIEVEELP
ncbi:hypothetical protein QIS99_31245 [Streptomyces sp. B-S-A8]|uniref:PIN domain-containing protein n=1 Tax=Streptomyces solicavernae TaxID=3043614 RepID=A0ABT6S3R3_9ACTN|nr:hypothetical protein [Streptomyces sp. B-S-A8]MDI3390638.1 hypothetical protein [Streptomyces sp. B-S-A8]